MVTYPIHVKRKDYRGSKENINRKIMERNRIAGELEEYLNEQIVNQKENIKSYCYYTISHDTGYNIDTVRDLLFPVDCGSNGFTVCKEKQV